MRNLKNIGCSTSEIGGITATTWDVTTNSLICASGPTGPEGASALIRLKRIHYSRGLEVGETEIAAWDLDGPLPDPSKDKILSLHYLPDIATICIILAGGDIYIVREELQAGQERIEIVGSVDAGITAADWSPDEELLAISTGAGTFLFMTRDFEEVTNVTFGPEDLKLSKHVSVGWGKSETQFKGKRAKALRDPTVPEHVDEGKLSPCDDSRSMISWRGDGAYVAINTIEAENRRIIRVYSREGILDSVSEPVDGLEGSLSWRPAGNLITGVQRSKEYVQVVFFERNGLRHGQFRLRLTQRELEDWGMRIDLKWNNDSTVLAVSYLDRVQLWTMGNYHYYLKQEIHLGSAGNVQGVHSALGVSWHPEQALRLGVHSTYAEMDLNYTSTVAGGSTFIPNDHGLVSVIDGCNLKVTPLKRANVPPPMSLHEISLDRNVTDTAMSRSGACIAALDQQQLTVWKHDDENDEYSVASRHDLTVGSAGKILPRQVAFWGDSDIVFLVYSEDSHKDVIYKAALDQGKVTPTTLLELPFSISCLIPALNHDSIFLESTGGSIYELEDNRHGSYDTNGVNGTKTNEHTLAVKELLKNPPWPKSCPKIEVWQSDEKVKKRIIFGLTATGTLYAAEPWSGRQGSQLARNCTSFLVTQAHLIFTTSQHLLKFVHLTAHQDLEVPSDEPETDERCRSIERGAQLVTVMPSSYAVVLQMPRGNLETIFPRALVLAGIRKSIVTKDYRTAFLTCRNQRVDMNILHDYDPGQFMANVSLFVKQIKKVEHIDLFLSQLRDEDVCQTMYKNTLNFSMSDEVGPQTNGISYNALIAGESKVNRICDAFLQALGGLRESHLQNIITAHVCKAPPDLDAALSLIGRLREHGDESVERAVEHICFLADVNQIYNHALGLYDLDLTLLVAQQSQKDPREYLPYLQTLQEQPPLRRKFTIDNDLSRHTKALHHLHALHAFDELLTYTTKHALYPQALTLYRYDPPHLTILTRHHASFLLSHSHFHAGALAYASLSDHAAAYPAYRAAGLWREALGCASLVPLPAEELKALARDLAEGLVEARDFQAAATVVREYGGDGPGAARLLCRGHWYAEAVRVIALQGGGGGGGGGDGVARERLLEEVLDVGLVEGFAGMTELLAECKGQLGAQVPRLRELREKKVRDPLGFFEGGEAAGGGVDVPDNVSIAPTDASTTGGTFLTRYTGKTKGTLGTAVSRRSSKNRRREERKRAAGKKGSIYEEEYLVNSVRRLIERVNGVGEEVERLVEGLVRRGMRERARAVEEAMVEVTEACKGCIGEVFEVVDENKSAAEAEKGEIAEYRPSGGEGVLWESMEQAWKRQEPPVVKAFQRLSLLG
ncbi:MAG: hypothetical protein Q9165_000663 [Trypethelium subeluteriae]